jgi:hypothetical protein
MQDIDRVADVQALSEPAGSCGMRMQGKSRRLVSLSQDAHRIGGRLGRRWHLGQKQAARPAELKLAIGASIELITLFVDGAVVAATQQREVRERRGAAVGPVPDVMALAERQSAPWKAAAAVAILKRTS